jgi:hypothetical protein
MLSSTILDVAIGLIFIYLLLALESSKPVPRCWKWE